MFYTTPDRHKEKTGETMDIFEVNRRVAYLLHEWDSPNGRTNRESYRSDFLTLLDCAHRVFRKKTDMMDKLPDSQSDPIIGLRKIEALTRQCYEAKQADDEKYFYPDHPFIVGYSIPENEIPWAVGKLNKAFNQIDNYQNPKWAWMGGCFGNKQISLLEKFVGQRWEEENNINTMADLISVIDEDIKKHGFLGLLKSKLRRCCNIQNPDLLAWEEIFAAIKEYLSVERKSTKTNTKKQAGTNQSSGNAGKKKTNKEKVAFGFNEGQAFYNNQDFGLPAGETIDILQKLVVSLGKVVKHKTLDTQSSDSNASDILKGRISVINKALKKHKAPYKIESKRGYGYVLKSTKTT